jgi:nicotinate-nucleotide pyrophosphorylase (carboxylating)
MTDALTSFIENALLEDIGDGDKTTLATIPSHQKGIANFIVKENCLIAGIELTSLICEKVDNQLVVNFNFTDGQYVDDIPCTIGNITGSIHSILKAERVLLNCMQRMSAIATKTNHFVELVKPFGVQILDTRKTTPNFRVCEKWAVKIGGGVNHRIGLYDQILIKDNHIKAAGDIQKAIESCIKYVDHHHLTIPIIVEVKNKEEFKIASSYNEVDRILLDNMTPLEIEQIVQLNNQSKLLEASGGINQANIEDYAKTKVDYISIGDLTHHVHAVDISLKIV